MTNDRIRPRVINVDGQPAYARATAELKRFGDLGWRCRCRPSPYLNNLTEQDHSGYGRTMWSGNADSLVRSLASLPDSTLSTAGPFTVVQALFATDP